MTFREFLRTLEPRTRVKVFYPSEVFVECPVDYLLEDEYDGSELDLTDEFYTIEPYDKFIVILINPNKKKEGE